MSLKKRLVTGSTVVALLLIIVGSYGLRTSTKEDSNPTVSGSQVVENSETPDAESTEFSEDLDSVVKPAPTVQQDQNITLPDEIKEYIKGLSIEQKVGALFMGGVYNQDMLTAQLSLISEKSFGGIILMGVNVSTPDKRVETLRRVNEVNNPDYPLLIAIDEEGGKVSRLWDQLSEQTSQTEISTNRKAYDVAYKRGTELHDMGINVNFSPVIDTIQYKDSFLYDRVFHTTSQKIAELGVSMVNGYRDSGVIAVPKHYPGHPDSETDSHKGLPVSNISPDEFNKYSETFRLTIFNSEPEMIMSGHISFPRIDNKYPATLSVKILQDKLRAEYGYNGVVITDDMNMGAIRDSFGTAEAAVLAINAGNDILLYITSPDIQLYAYRAVIEAVNEGRISQDRIDESVERVLRLRAGM